MTSHDDVIRLAALVSARTRTPSMESSSTSSSLAKTSRAPRFAEATAVHSPTESRSRPFSEKARTAHSRPGDIGFGYINEAADREITAVTVAPTSPLKSAMKVPGTPGRGLNPLSPTFREEQSLEAQEKSTEKRQTSDLKIKTRVRMAKMALRGVNFSCSLLILSMVSATLSIFHATKAIPAMSGLPPWADNTKTWPQVVVLSCACVSLLICMGVFIGYCRGGHKRAEKVGVYYTLFAVGWFIFSMIMWAVAAGILQYTRNNGNNKDLWGWACVDNRRSKLQGQHVDYALVCRLQNWAIICIIIEFVIEVISITLYSVIFYRYWTKRKLHKSMDMRDKARSDLYLAQLRSQSAPNTPGLGPKSPALSQYALSPRFPPSSFQSLNDVDQDPTPLTPNGTRFVVPQSQFSPRLDTGFKLQAPPTRANPATPSTPKSAMIAPMAPTMTPPTPQFDEYASKAEGEQQYEAVPIPGAYSGQAVKGPPAQHASFRQYR